MLCLGHILSKNKNQAYQFCVGSEKSSLSKLETTLDTQTDNTKRGKRSYVKV